MSTMDQGSGFPPPADRAGNASSGQCYLCGQTIPADLMVRFGDTVVCAGCKPRYLQMIQQGLNKPGERRYGGFWIRFVAYLIDVVALSVMNVILGLLLATPFIMSVRPGQPPVFTSAAIIKLILGTVLGLTYFIFFVGKYGATPGKMACGLKIVTSDNGRVSYMRALGRYFAQILSAIILCIGYLMIGFDREKRGLHDRICDTRVVAK
ncbi:MAG: RDD family protein [Syntrophobacteraceae bacterium]|nr:RDD family protein [Syntrophobacteraceae bacterium]